MKIVPADRISEELPWLIQVLSRDGVIAYPTDTLYGLGCDAFSKIGVERIWQLKGRTEKKPISIVCANLQQVREYAQMSDYATRVMKQVLPGPFTVVLPITSKTPPLVCSKDGKVGIRIPANEICLELVRRLGRPITSTSVNKAGQPPLTTPEEIAKNFPELDAVIDAGPLNSLGSTVIDATGEEVQVIREGIGELHF